MFETILGAIFILGLFLFTAYGLPKMGYKVKGKRFVNNYTPKEDTKYINPPLFFIPKNTIIKVIGGHGGSETKNRP